MEGNERTSWNFWYIAEVTGVKGSAVKYTNNGCSSINFANVWANRCASRTRSKRFCRLGKLFYRGPLGHCYIMLARNSPWSRSRGCQVVQLLFLISSVCSWLQTNEGDVCKERPPKPPRLMRLPPWWSRREQSRTYMRMPHPREGFHRAGPQKVSGHIHSVSGIDRDDINTE